MRKIKLLIIVITSMFIVSSCNIRQIKISVLPHASSELKTSETSEPTTVISEAFGSETNMMAVNGYNEQLLQPINSFLDLYLNIHCGHKYNPADFESIFDVNSPYIKELTYYSMKPRYEYLITVKHGPVQFESFDENRHFLAVYDEGDSALVFVQDIYQYSDQLHPDLHPVLTEKFTFTMIRTESNWAIYNIFTANSQDNSFIESTTDIESLLLDLENESGNLSSITPSETVYSFEQDNTNLDGFPQIYYNGTLYKARFCASDLAVSKMTLDFIGKTIQAVNPTLSKENEVRGMPGGIDIYCCSDGSIIIPAGYNTANGYYVLYAID